MAEKGKNIFWEDYKTNYVDSQLITDDVMHSHEFEDDDDGEFEDFDDENEAVGAGPITPEELIRKMGITPIPIIGGMNIDRIVSTPWGNYSAENKFAPFNFYNLKLAHFKGFSTHSIPKFTEIMDSVDGVAVWKPIDPYCVAIGKGRAYEWSEVIINVQQALLGKSEKEELIEKTIQDVIALHKDKGIEKYTAIIFPDGKVFKAYPEEDDYARRIAEMDDLSKKLKAVIIENGVVRC